MSCNCVGGVSRRLNVAVFAGAFFLLLLPVALAPAIPIAARTKIKQAAASAEAARGPIVESDAGGDRRVLLVVDPTDDPDDRAHYAEAALGILATQSGGFALTVSQDGSELDSFAKLKEGYDAIAFVNDASRLFEKEGRRGVLSEFLASEKGLILISDGVRTADDWPGLQAAMGGKFGNRGEARDETIWVEGLEHRINQGFDSPSVELHDAIVIPEAGTFSRNESRVLMSVFRKVDGDRQGDGGSGKRVRVPISWIRFLPGGGRVFVCTLGMADTTYFESGVLAQWIAGAEYACGALRASAKPSGELTGFYFSLADCLPEVRGIGAGDDPHVLSAAAELVYNARESGEADRAQAEEELIGLLNAEDASVPARRFAGRQLRVVGKRKAFDALSALVEDEVVGESAKYALIRMEPIVDTDESGKGEVATAGGDEMNRLLFEKVMNGENSSAVRVACVDILRKRGAKEYLGDFHDQLISSPDPVLRHSVIRFIGKLDVPSFEYAREMIEDYLETDDAEDAGVYEDALVDMFQPGSGQLAYPSLFTAAVNEDEKTEVREVERACAVAKRVGGFRGSQMVIMFGASDDPEVWKAMVDAVVNWPGGLGHKAAMALAQQHKMKVDRHALYGAFVRMLDEMQGYPALYRATGLSQVFDQSEWEDVDLAVMEALAFVADPNSLSAAVKALETRKSGRVRRAAVRVIVLVSEKIGTINHVEARGALEKALEFMDSDDEPNKYRGRAQHLLETIQK